MVISQLKAHSKFEVSLLYMLLVYYRLFQYFAKIGPVILCTKLNTAPGTADKGLKCTVANVTANPEFCIPT